METHEAEKDARDALAGIDRARSSVARRIDVPRWLDAVIAVSTGAYLVLVAFVDARWVAVAVGVWVGLYVFLVQRRHRRAGVDTTRRHERIGDASYAIVWLAILVLFAASLFASGAAAWAPIVGGVVCAVVAYAGFRWANRRAVARARGQA